LTTRQGVIVANQEKFSGWAVLVSCFFIMFFIQGGIQAFAVFLPAIMNETGFSLGEVALISTIATVVAFAANMSFGYFARKFSVKIVLLFGAILAVANTFIISKAHSLLGLYVAAGCAGLAIAFGTLAPISAIMSNWFVKNRATFMSVVIAGSMFGGAIIMFIAGRLIHYFDWRVAYQYLGLSVAVACFTAIFGFIVDHPAKKGQKAYGALEMETETEAKDAAPADRDNSQEARAPEKAETPSDGVAPEEARGSASFWLLLTGVFLVGCSTNIENFLPAFWQSEGMSVPASTATMSLYALMTGVCSILLGRVSDKMGGRAYIALTTGAFVLGATLIYVVGAGASHVVIMAIIPFAIGGKKTSTLTPALVVAEAFGRRSYGALIGYFAGVLQLGIAVSNPIIGGLHKSFGGYKTPFFAMGCLNVAALILIILALTKAPAKKARKIA
jgi:MFS family permease